MLEIKGSLQAFFAAFSRPRHPTLGQPPFHQTDYIPHAQNSTGHAVGIKWASSSSRRRGSSIIVDLVFFQVGQPDNEGCFSIP